MTSTTTTTTTTTTAINDNVKDDMDLPHTLSLPSIDEIIDIAISSADHDHSHSLPPSPSLSKLKKQRDKHKQQQHGNGSGSGGGQWYSQHDWRPHRRNLSSVTTTSSHSSKMMRSSDHRARFTKSKSENSNSSTSAAASASSPSSSFQFQTTQILQNMTKTNKNRNPYKDYLVLGLIGKGSIGSVEKVVRRHHHHIHSGQSSMGDLDADADANANYSEGGLFNCCKEKKVQSGGRDSLCFWGIFSKLFNSNQNKSKDAFQSSTATTTTTTTVTNTPPSSTDSTRTIISEASAFSAPSSPTMQMLPATKSRLTSSTHGAMMIRSSPNNSPHTRSGSRNHIFNTSNNNHHPHHNAQQHPLRKYALKSIRLDRHTTNTGKGKKNKNKNKNSPSSSSSAGISSADEAELRNEISILRSLDHPHVVHVIETYEFRNSIYMVIDLCENGDLYVLDPYREHEAKTIMRQLLQAVSYMHHRGIVHRDLKYENVMFTDRGSGRSKLEIKVIDFGLSMKYGKSKGKLDMSESMTDFVGTIYTMAPEVIRGSYTYKCDLWSLGVMAYMLLSSQIPFCGKDMKEIGRRIMFSAHSFTGRRWSKISKHGRDFVSSLLVRDVGSRPTADQALKHPWLVTGGHIHGNGHKHRHHKPSLIDSRSLHRRHSSETIGGTTSIFSMLKMISPPLLKPLDGQICTSIENYSTYSWMHRLALMVIAYRYTGGETTHLRRVFTSYDVDDSGTVEAEELRNAFALHGKYGQDYIDQIFLAVDMNGSGKISWTEFLAATIETKGHISPDEFSSAFEHLDFDRNGYISTSDLREIIGRDLPQSVIDQIIDESDIIGDHKIWKDEFLALGEESTAAVSNNLEDHQQRHVRVMYLKRSKSADDFDLVKTQSLDRMNSDPDVLGGDQFRIEKAKSVRKATKIT